MADIHLHPIGQKVTVVPGGRLLDALLAADCPVMMACGGQGICATCHAYLESGGENVSPIEERERRTLALITGATSQSRLTCQCRVAADGPVHLRLPDVLYAESLDDIESLIGQRAQRAIVHPADGRVLVAAGKIITRSRLHELAEVDFSILDAEVAHARLRR